MEISHDRLIAVSSQITNHLKEDNDANRVGVTVNNTKEMDTVWDETWDRLIAGSSQITNHLKKDNNNNRNGVSVNDAKDMDTV